MPKLRVEHWVYDFDYNGKEEGCGDLIMTLFKFFKTVDKGKVVRITAYDMGAELDVAAWCRSTNKDLLKTKPPHFLIKKN